MVDDFKQKLKRCPACGENYEKCLSMCPNCGYKEPLSFKKTAVIFILIILAALPFIILSSFDISEYFKDNEQKVVDNIQTKAEIQENTVHEPSSTDEINIPLRDISELSYLSKEDIFEKRKGYVKNSLIFKNEDYSPNENVYQIEDDLPWIGAYEIAVNGVKDNPDIGKGESRNSISVNNPELLVSFLIPDFSKKNKNTGKFTQADYFLPKKLSWVEKEKTIKAYFDVGLFYKMNPNYVGMVMYVDETNARDMGYNWVYCDKSQNVQFADEIDNISSEPYEMRGYYHKGYSCGIESGCNNYSPYQREFPFRVTDDSGYLRLKMWKEKPESKLQEPDIIYEMYL